MNHSRESEIDVLAKMVPELMDLTEEYWETFESDLEGVINGLELDFISQSKDRCSLPGLSIWFFPESLIILDTLFVYELGD